MEVLGGLNGWGVRRSFWSQNARRGWYKASYFTISKTFQKTKNYRIILLEHLGKVMKGQTSGSFMNKDIPLQNLKNDQNDLLGMQVLKEHFTHFQSDVYVISQH